MLIEHQCPKCGAPAILEETDHLFTCEFCRVKSFLLSRVYRYVLPHKAPEDKDLVFVPYWRFKGMLFSCIDRGIQHKIVDVSYQGCKSHYFPVSVGLRSQAMKLRFVSPETEGYFLRPTLGFNKVLEIIEDRYSIGISKPIHYQEFIGDSLSILYSPFYMEGRIYDAVLNEPISEPLPDDFNLSAFGGGHADWHLRFVPAQCPECGWDLDGERDSLALGCRNCRTVWQAGNGKFMKLKYAHIPLQVNGNELTYPEFNLRLTRAILNYARHL